MSQENKKIVFASVGKGFFMHFSTVAGNPGDHAHLSVSQCLQFYLHNSGGADDALKVWVREYDQANPRGKLRLVQRVPGLHIIGSH